MIGERQIPLLDLRAQYSTIRREVQAAVNSVMESQWFVLGEEVRKLEESIAEYSGARYGVGCASGSDALSLALMVLGIEPGDEVVTVPYTFFATAGEISGAGAVPVFVDVDDKTFNMDTVQLAEVLRTRPKIRAIMPVHLFGGCADMDEILTLANQYGIPVIEDAAQSIGSEYKGRRAGGIGDIGCFSFFPSKNLGAFGDGGMLTTNDEKLAERLKSLRVHGRTGKYIHEWIGVNSRLDALQAAILNVKFTYLDQWTRARQDNAAAYRRMLAKSDTPVVVQTPAEYQTRHVYNQFVVRCPKRDQLQTFLRERGIGTEVYYPLPLHMQPCYKSLGYNEGDFPVSERLSQESLSLPVHSELPGEDLEYICQAIHDFYA
jgi:dTDP-4-amino-4,6-dideoxygalactose transaminase